MAVIKYKSSDGQWHMLSNVLVQNINVVQTTGSSSTDVMSQSAVTEALNGVVGIYTPTLESAPTTATTTYTKDGETKNYEIGQFCRIVDASMDAGYKFYQLYDLQSNGTVAVWQELGTPLERTALSVTSNNPSLLTSLRSSAVITVTDEDDNEVFSGTLPQTRTLKLTPGISYTVSAAPVTGYATPSSQTFEAEYEGIRSIDMEYDTTVLTVVLASDTGEADLSDVTITVTDTTVSSTISAQQDGTYLIPTGHDYSVAVSDDVDGYDAPDAVTGTASDTTASVTMTYTKITGYVDLGLPSGLLWATGNLVKNGTTGEYSIADETDYGSYFSRGNIDGHNRGEGYNFNSTTYQNTDGYALKDSDITPDGGHDAARENLGGPWRMISKADYDELAANTTRTVESDFKGTGIAGMKYTAANGNYVFFPFVGQYNGTSLADNNTTTFIWVMNGAYESLRMRSSDAPMYGPYNMEHRGWSIRPIMLPHYDITITLNTTDGTSASGISVTVTDSEGTTHTGTTDANGQVELQGVANGSATVSITNYIVSPNTITISNSTKSFTCNCSYAPLGVWAYYSNGTLKSEAEADSNAIGVAVITNNCRFVIDKQATNSDSSIRYGGYGKDLSSIGVVVTSDAATAKLDFDGEGNTTKLINALNGYNDGYVTGAAAAEACRAAFSGNGYMGSLGEWNEAYANKASVDSMMTKIGGTAINSSYHWASTLYNASNSSWLLSWGNGSTGSYGRIGSIRVRAFKAL